MPTPFDWTPIFGIEFRFSSASNPTAATSLNKAYSKIIGKDELSEFFVTREDEEEEDGPLEIAPDPQLHILNCIAKAIAINLVEPPPDEITKGHIANLLDKCVIKHVRNGGSTKRMRYKTDFDAAAKHAILIGPRIATLLLFVILSVTVTILERVIDKIMIGLFLDHIVLSFTNLSFHCVHSLSIVWEYA
eukprot:jgi/Psemu1/3656/gm1.3656_g